MEVPGSIARLLPALALPVGLALAQTQTRSGVVQAVPDASSTETGGALLDVPGIGDDFELFADGDLETRANGTARLAAFVQRASALDRDFYVVLEFSGRVAPGDAGYPPIGGPVLTLQPSAYVPQGPVDPTNFVYYTAVSGTVTGTHAFAGERFTVTNLTPVQLGDGASNKNVLAGLAVNLDLLPVTGTLVPTGPAALRANLVADQAVCLTHVDDHPGMSGSTARRGVSLPGVADDYVFRPAGQFVEHGDGTASVSATLQRQSDYADGWQLAITLSSPLVPGDAAYPPAGHPVTQLLPAMYTAGGGPVDPAQYRYYQQATGTLIGLDHNTGGLVQLTLAGSAQLGLGAAQGNAYFGIAADFVAAVTQQPNTTTINPTGALQFAADLATICILPTPLVTSASTAALPSVTDQTVTLTGIDLGFCEQAALGPIVLGGGERRWFEGHLHVIDHSTVEVAIPQGLVPATYPLSLLNTARTSNAVTLDVVPPTSVTLRTEIDRMPGEAQHWVVHQGDVQGFAFCFLLLSTSNVPSLAPGLVDLGIGNQFADLVLFDVQVHDFVTGVALTVVPSIPPALQGIRLYAQAALMDATYFPLHPSDVRFTDY